MFDETQRFIQEQVASSQLNLLPPAYGSTRFFAAPIIGVASGNDPIFMRFKEVVAEEHLAPSEMWIRTGMAASKNLAAGLRIVSIILPYESRIREAGEKNETNMPPEIYCIARNLANPFIDFLLERTVNFFRKKGFQSTSGIRSPAFHVYSTMDPFRRYSNWSERHIAFAAGLGSFSLHEGLITDVGCNIRIGSVITDAPLEVTPRLNNEPYAYCPYYVDGTCGKCIAKCPAGAITENGHDKHKCYLYGKKVRNEMLGRPLRSLLQPSEIITSDGVRTAYSVGCALCQFGVPCTDRNPVST
jgi:epoxyqueuosine reductase QueG